MAWYEGNYAPWWNAPYSGYGGWPRYPLYNSWYPEYGYAEPRWYFRGRMNQYGDYEFVFRMENVSPNDLYNAWLWYQYSQQ